METCCVVDQFCTSPANLEPPVAARAHCYLCDQAVCSKCSSIRLYPDWGRVRMCNNCQVEWDGNDKIVMRRLRKMAGY